MAREVRWSLEFLCLSVCRLNVALLRLVRQRQSDKVIGVLYVWKQLGILTVTGVVKGNESG